MDLESRRFLSRRKLGVFSIIAALALSACSGDDDNGSTGFPEPVPPVMTTAIVDANGNATTSVDVWDSVVFDAKNLDPNTQYSITVANPGGTELNPADGYIATTDEAGSIPNATIVHDFNTGSAAQLGTYTVTVSDSGGTEVDTLTFAVENNSHVYCTDNTQVARASFLPTENAFAKVERGGGALADGSYDAYVIPDFNPALQTGDLLIGSVGVVTVASGEGVLDLGQYPPGSYDVVIDTTGNGRYDEGADLISRPQRLHSCFTVQAANSASPMIGQICSDRNGNNRDVFDTNSNAVGIRDMFASITPGEQSSNQAALGVDKYVVQHQNVWTNGDVLNDVSAVVEVDPVRRSSSNETPWLVWPRQNMAAGCYDVVIDVNRNGVFDAGIDYVDNVDNTGQASCGCRVADSACSSNITITSPLSGSLTNATAVTIAGSVAGTPVSGFVTVTAGSQSNRIDITVTDGNFSPLIPLFDGRNEITVSFIYADGSACARTLILSSSSTIGESLFRVQLTWDGDTDMDLHLVRPTGLYDNGASSGSNDDCNYANCNVGLTASSANTIDWGSVGEADDPKLDVDCIACGNGIENIWMTQISEDGNYTVYVDAFSGTETDVTATIFIGNAQVGRVNCGDMDAGNVTDSCRVGTINWTGGTSGSGFFTPDGTKAADF